MKAFALILALTLVLTSCAYGVIKKKDGTTLSCVTIGHAECKSCDAKDDCDSIKGGYGSADLYAFLAGVASGVVSIFVVGS